MLSNKTSIYSSILSSQAKQKKLLSLLIDPDKIDEAELNNIISLSKQTHIDFFFIGGSLLIKNNLDYVVQQLKKFTQIPVLLFPGSNNMISREADAFLLLSLISGRNPELLIGKHVENAAFLKQSGLEIIPTAYMLIDGGNSTSVAYMSNTSPIPSTKNDIAVSTALAGELLGMKLVYLEAGSGALNPVPKSMILEVSKNTNIPIIVGGGINTVHKAKDALDAGADMIVVGTAFEKNPEFLLELGNLFI